MTNTSSSSTFTVDPTSETTSSANLSELPATAAYLSGISNSSSNSTLNINSAKNKSLNNILGNSPLGAISTNLLANTNEETASKNAYAKQFNQSKFKNVTNTLNTELPPGWRAVRYNNGNLYYENTKTGKTQQNYPDVTRAGNSTNLPEGWETYSYQGQNFYVDPQGQSHWNKPSSGKNNTRQIVENELAPKEEAAPGPLPPQNVPIKNKNKNNNVSPAGLFGNNNLEVENLKKNSGTGNATVKANKARNQRSNRYTPNRPTPMNTNSNRNSRNRNTRQTRAQNECPVCPVCPKPSQQNTEQLKQVVTQIKNIQSLVTNIKSSLQG
jgi:hypothetical protein